MTEQELRKELDELKKQIQQLSPRGFSSDLVGHLQSLLFDVSLRLEAHNQVLTELLPEFSSRFDTAYSELKKAAEDSDHADFDHW